MKEFFTNCYQTILAHIVTVLVYIILIGCYQVFFDYLSKTVYFVLFLLFLGKVHEFVVKFFKKLLEKYLNV